MRIWSHGSAEDDCDATSPSSVARDLSALGPRPARILPAPSGLSIVPSLSQLPRERAAAESRASRSSYASSHVSSHASSLAPSSFLTAPDFTPTAKLPPVAAARPLHAGHAGLLPDPSRHDASSHVRLRAAAPVPVPESFADLDDA